MAGKKPSDGTAQSKLTGAPKESGATAEQLAKKQREVGVAEFFSRNKHMLGFDNPRKALLTTIKEAVDNSLDACEEASILPEILVEVIEMAENRYRIIVEDNGPGIVKRNVGKVFAKLLYGSKFHSRKQQRGQQGIGISAAVMYAQLTTGRAAKITSRIGPKQLATYMELTIDTATNSPKIINESEKEWKKEHGTRIELDIEATYQKGAQSVDEYLKQTAVVNPHATIIYVNPKAEQYVFARATEVLPKKAQEILPHPHGIEIGTLIKMLAETENRTLSAFLQNSFSRVSDTVAKEILEHARIQNNADPHAVASDGAEAIIRGINKTAIMAPPTNCLSPIGAELLEKGIKKEVQAEFYAATSRDPIVYKGNPFQVEVALAYGGQQDGDKAARLMRFANRVPLLFQQGACGTTAAVTDTNWKAYNLSQPGGGMPIGALTIAIHISSVWVPYTSESKEAIANNDDIVKEIKLGLQQAGRELGKYLAKKHKANRLLERAGIFERYTPEVANALARLTGEDEKKILAGLSSMIEKDAIVSKLEAMKAENTEYDEEWSKIGKEDEVEEEESEEEDAPKDKKAKGEKKSEDAPAKKKGGKR